jgi:alpha-D-ribose 1-methylphosphonate 5-triphosphate synthase subunit PhnH
MIDHDLRTMGAGFSNLALGSQKVFRSAMQAMSHPGRCTSFTHDAQPPTSVDPTAAVLLLSLLDADCVVWGSPRLQNSDALHWLRFHTGCALAPEPSGAQFVWIAQGDALPTFSHLAQGSDTFPDQSVTCVIEVEALSSETAPDAWMLTGPGIETQTPLQIAGLCDSFFAQWQENILQFPRGADSFLTTARHFVALPRTTRISTRPRALEEQ